MKSKAPLVTYSACAEYSLFMTSLRKHKKVLFSLEFPKKYFACSKHVPFHKTVKRKCFPHSQGACPLGVTGRHTWLKRMKWIRNNFTQDTAPWTPCRYRLFCLFLDILTFVLYVWFSIANSSLKKWYNKVISYPIPRSLFCNEVQHAGSSMLPPRNMP